VNVATARNQASQKRRTARRRRRMDCCKSTARLEAVDFGFLQAGHVADQCVKVRRRQIGCLVHIARIAHHLILEISARQKRSALLKKPLFFIKLVLQKRKTQANKDERSAD
jgi:hypothetical protein